MCAEETGKFSDRDRTKQFVCFVFVFVLLCRFVYKGVGPPVTGYQEKTRKNQEVRRTNKKKKKNQEKLGNNQERQQKYKKIILHCKPGGQEEEKDSQPGVRPPYIFISCYFFVSSSKFFRGGPPWKNLQKPKKNKNFGYRMFRRLV